MLPHKIIDRLLNWENNSDKALFVVGSPLYAQSSAWFRGKAAKQRTGQKAPTTTSLMRPTQSEDVVVAGSEG